MEGRRRGGAVVARELAGAALGALGALLVQLRLRGGALRALLGDRGVAAAALGLTAPVAGAVAARPGLGACQLAPLRGTSRGASDERDHDHGSGPACDDCD